VLGDGAGLPATATLAELDEHRVANATRALASAEILRPESPLGFVHPLVRDAVYLELAPAERELQHERAARALIELEAAPELVAAHLRVVPCRADAWVAALLREAVLAAGLRGDPESAVLYLRRALAEPPEAEQRNALLIELGMAEALANDKASSAEHLRAGYEAVVDPRARAEMAETLARVLMFTVSFGGSVDGASERLAQARGGLRGDGPGARMFAVVAAWDWALTAGPASACAELALAALADGALVAADPALLSGVAGSVLILADRDEAVGVWEATSADAHRSGSVMALSGMYVCQGWTWLTRGELAEAESSLRRGIEEKDPWRAAGAAETAYAVSFLARVLIERGDLAGARALLTDRAPSPAGSDGDGLCRLAEVELLVAERRWTEALAAADDYTGSLRDGIVNPAWAPWRSLRALALAGLDRRDEAGELLADELEWARRWGAPGALGRTLRLLSVIGPAPGVERSREAVEVTEDSPARLEHAKALVAFGSTLRRARKPMAARDSLRLGLEIAARCGAQPLVEHARAELYAAGARPKRDALTGPESLTPSERRVAELAARGQANRDIAQTLYVTEKTVEFHLTSAYRKLGISTRAGLSEILASAVSA
jgi:DNA-binding CsgD family transcriptional regulator